MHRVFDSPVDTFVFDTGHQAYVHKMMTGRMGRFETLRQQGGMSGYPSRAESDHDLVENSHASTGLWYALAVATARELAGEAGKVVCVIGDGALTGGMAYEALNNIGQRQPELIIILNDNGRSYAPTIGGIADNLGQLRLSRTTRPPRTWPARRCGAARLRRERVRRRQAHEELAEEAGESHPRSSRPWA